VAQPGIETVASAHDPNSGAVVRVDSLGPLCAEKNEVYGVCFVAGAYTRALFSST
jgi:hypothetical protein